jgi:hypothetical protein
MFLARVPIGLISWSYARPSNSHALLQASVVLLEVDVAIGSAYSLDSYSVEFSVAGQQTDHVSFTIVMTSKSP